MLFPGYEATMLALEANGVIGLRLTKIAHGGVDAGLEINLMVQEKFDAAAEALTTLVGGGSVEVVLSGYRRRVTLNARRLSFRKEDAMKKELEGDDNPGRDRAGEQPKPREVQGEALQMNDNSAGGKKPASPQPSAADKPSPHKGQGKALQVNENSSGE
jgi:hypothetical protein